MSINCNFQWSHAQPREFLVGWIQGSCLLSVYPYQCRGKEGHWQNCWFKVCARLQYELYKWAGTISGFPLVWPCAVCFLSLYPERLEMCLWPCYPKNLASFFLCIFRQNCLRDCKLCEAWAKHSSCWQGKALEDCPTKQHLLLCQTVGAFKESLKEKAGAFACIPWGTPGGCLSVLAHSYLRTRGVPHPHIW